MSVGMFIGDRSRRWSVLGVQIARMKLVLVLVLGAGVGLHTNRKNQRRVKNKR